MSKHLYRSHRGLVGTILVYKITGALALDGGSIDDVETLAQYVAENVATYGVGLEHCHVPGTEAGDSRLAADELELGASPQSSVSCIITLTIRLLL